MQDNVFASYRPAAHTYDRALGRDPAAAVRAFVTRKACGIFISSQAARLGLAMAPDLSRREVAARYRDAVAA